MLAQLRIKNDLGLMVVLVGAQVKMLSHGFGILQIGLIGQVVLTHFNIKGFIMG